MSKFLVLLNSDDRVSGDSTDFTCTISEYNLAPGTTISVGVHSVNFLNLQYPVNSTNNMIIFQENSVVSNLTATIAVGNYTYTEFVTAVKSALDNAGANTYTVTFNLNTSTISITTVLPDTFKIISINNKLTGMDVTSAFASSATGLYPINLSGNEFVDLQLLGFSSENLTSNVYNSNGIAARIPLISGFGDLVEYNAFFPDSSMTIDHQSLAYIRCRLRNPNGTAYQLGNQSLSIVLICEKIYN